MLRGEWFSFSLIWFYIYDKGKRNQIKAILYVKWLSQELDNIPFYSTSLLIQTWFLEHQHIELQRRKNCFFFVTKKVFCFVLLFALPCPSVPALPCPALFVCCCVFFFLIRSSNCYIFFYLSIGKRLLSFCLFIQPSMYSIHSKL